MTQSNLLGNELHQSPLLWWSRPQDQLYATSLPTPTARIKWCSPRSLLGIRQSNRGFSGPRILILRLASTITSTRSRDTEFKLDVLWVLRINHKYGGGIMTSSSWTWGSSGGASAAGSFHFDSTTIRSITSRSSIESITLKSSSKIGFVPCSSTIV